MQLSTDLYSQSKSVGDNRETAELNDLRCLCLEEGEQIWRRLQEDVGGCPTAGHVARVGPRGSHDKKSCPTSAG
jgi:hypothetical protein